MSFWDQLVDGLRGLGDDIAVWLPRIIVALLVLIIGRWIALLIRKAVVKVLDSGAAGGVFERAGINQALTDTGYTAAGLAGTVIYAFLMVVVYLITARVLQIDPIVDLLQELIAFLPLIVVAIAIVVIAAAIANFAADLVGPFADRSNVHWLRWIVRLGILVVGVVTAMDLLNIGFVTNTLFSIVIGGAAIGFAIAFGVGGIDTAKKWWAKYLAPSETAEGSAPPAPRSPSAPPPPPPPSAPGG